MLNLILFRKKKGKKSCLVKSHSAEMLRWRPRGPRFDFITCEQESHHPGIETRKTLIVSKYNVTKKNDITSLLPFLHPYAAAIQKCLGKCALWMIFRSTENGLILVNLCNKKCMGLHILHWTAVRSHIRNASCSPFAALRFTDSACAASQCTEVQASCMHEKQLVFLGRTISPWLALQPWAHQLWNWRRSPCWLKTSHVDIKHTWHKLQWRSQVCLLKRRQPWARPKM